ncbi:MAG: diguanylate cyclase [Myxococcaceae bacterium]|nr:diguanylate cyclase [Myxococcaceae bacterium]
MHVLRSIGRKLFVAIALPTALVAVVGVGLVWRQTDLAVREESRRQALGLAGFIATSFGTVERTQPGTTARVAHRSVTAIVRSDWSGLQVASGIRIVGGDGTVRWSRRIEEEDKAFADAARVKHVTEGQAVFTAPPVLWPWGAGGGGEVLYPLGGVSCGGCHTGDATLRTGVLQLTVEEPSLRRHVSDVFAQALWSVLIFTIVLVAAVALSLRLVLTRKLKRLARVMQRAEGGDLVVRAPDLGADELGSLAQSFNRMLARITELKVTEIDTQRDLAHARAELELKAELGSVNKRLETRVGELEVLFDLARTIASTLDLNEVLTRLTTLLPSRLKVDRFSVMLLNQEGKLEVQKAFPVSEGSEGLVFELGEGIAGHGALTRKSVYVPDLEVEKRFKLLNPAAMRGRGCLLSIPMLHGPELLGVLNFERREKADFDREEIEYFTAVADQAAIAVQNARLHEQTVALSITDPLTGVPNRRHLFQQLEAEVNRALRYGTPVSLVMIDIDHFKHLNDAAGHRAGDVALKQVCQALKRIVRKVDTLARYGGEEFVVLLPQVGRDEALEVAEKLRHVVEETAFDNGALQPGGRVTISLGVATLPTDAADQARLIDAADSALYASKRGGRNKVTGYTPGMEQHPGRERGPYAQRRRTGEVPAVKA